MPHRRRSRRRDGTPLLLVAMILAAAVLVPLAYLAVSQMFAILWQSGNLVVEGPEPITLSELKQRGTWSFTFNVRSTAPGGGQTNTAAGAARPSSSPQPQSVVIMASIPPVTLVNPYPTVSAEFLPAMKSSPSISAGLISPDSATKTPQPPVTPVQPKEPVKLPPGGKAPLAPTTPSLPVPITQTSERTGTATTPQVTQTTTATTTTATATVGAERYPCPGPEFSGCTLFQEVTVGANQAAVLSVVVQHMRLLSARVIIHLEKYVEHPQTGSGWAIMDTVDFIIREGETRRVTFTTPCGPGRFRLEVNIVANRLAPSDVAASFDPPRMQSTCSSTPTRTNTQAQPLEVREFSFYSLSADLYSQLGGGLRLIRSESTYGKNPAMSITLPASISYPVRYFDDGFELRIRYCEIKARVYGDWSRPTREQPVPGFERVTVPVPEGGMVYNPQDSRSVYCATPVAKIPYSSLVIMPPNAWYMRNVVTNFDTGEISLEVVNTFSERLTFDVGAFNVGGWGTNTPISSTTVTVNPGSSVKVVLNVARHIHYPSKEEVIRNYRSWGQRTISVYVEARWDGQIPGYAEWQLNYYQYLIPRTQRLEAIFRIPWEQVKLRVSVSGPGTVEVRDEGGRVLGGPGEYNVDVSSNVIVKARPTEQNAFLCSVIARTPDGKYVRYEPCDALVMSGQKVLPETWTFPIGPSDINVEFTFKRITDPDVTPFRARGSTGLDVSQKVTVSVKPTIKQVSVTHERPEGRPGDPGVTRVRASISIEYTVHNDWDFPVRATLQGTVTATLVLTRTAQPFTTTLNISPKSSAKTMWEFEIEGTYTPRPDIPGRSTTAIIHVSTHIVVNADDDYQVNERGQLVRVIRQGGRSAPPVELLIPLGDAPASATARTGTVYIMDGSGRTVIIRNGNATAYQSPINIQYTEVPVLVETPSGQRSVVTAVEAPPAANMKNVNLGTNVIQPERAPPPSLSYDIDTGQFVPVQQAGGPLGGIWESFIRAVAGFFDWLWRVLTGRG